MASFSIKLDLVAQLRSAIRSNQIDLLQACVLAELYGVDGISVQYRRDNKYIHKKDLFLLKETAKTKLVVEMPPLEEAVALMMDVQPSLVIFSADHADSDSEMSPIDFDIGGIDFSGFVSKLSGVNVRSGFFIEPKTEAVKGVSKSNGDVVLINCLGYTKARSLEEARFELDNIEKTAQAAARAELEVYLGRGISYKNIQPLISRELADEFVIGEAVVAKAMLLGIETAVKEMSLLVK